MYMLLNLVHQGFFMAKVDLKDAYLTVHLTVLPCSVNRVLLSLGLLK